MIRELNEGYVFRQVGCVHVIIREDDRAWWPWNEAPDECFADTEPGANTPWPQAGDRVYVSNPEGLHCAPRTEGWGTIGEEYITEGLLFVTMDQPIPGEDAHSRCFSYRRAACHREGPQDKPPGEEAVFLGRFEHTRGNMNDFWWLNGSVWRSGSCAGYTPGSLDYPTGYWEPKALAAFHAALAVARELGRCPPFKPEEVRGDIVEPTEPERPEPAYEVGQWVNDSQGATAVVRGRWYDGGWRYSVSPRPRWVHPPLRPDEVVGECVQESPEEVLLPHTMTAADIPHEVRDALFDGTPLRVVEVPVDPDGKPNRGCWSDTPYAGDMIEGPHAFLRDKRGPVQVSDRRWLWNLEVPRICGRSER